VLLAVTDEGPGIEADAMDKIFDAFFTTRSHGTGMGLAVVRRIIDDHANLGASIEVRSAGNGGSRRPGGATFEVGLARASSKARRTLATATVGPNLASDLPVRGGANARSRPPKSG
jgi:signal transduction histidine kinase